MQPNRFPDLFKHELALGLTFWRRKHLRASGNLDRIGIHYAHALEKLSKSEFETVIEAPQDGGIAVILLAWSVKVENFLHRTPLTEKSSYEAMVTAP